jgi:tRNA (cytidine/uridine-2'-O-)-methyltransferase
MSVQVNESEHRFIENPPLHVVLFQPEIPSNTGNIARLCGAAEITLHLIHPLGFRVDDRHLKRAGLDYWKAVDVRHHCSYEAFMEWRREGKHGKNVVAFSRHAHALYTEAEVAHGDFLLFGKETLGLPKDIRDRFPCFKIPIWGEVRSLNLATAAGIVVYHYLHGLGRF